MSDASMAGMRGGAKFKIKMKKIKLSNKPGFKDLGDLHLDYKKKKIAQQNDLLQFLSNTHKKQKPVRSRSK